MYIYSLMSFFGDNFHYFQTNSSVHEIDTRYKNDLHTPSVRLAAMQRGTIHSAVKIAVFFPTHAHIYTLKH